MTKKNRNIKARTSRSDEFKSEALKLAKVMGVSAAAQELDINPNQIYQWRPKLTTSARSSEREDKLVTEVARLKRELTDAREEVEILKKATAYFAKNKR